VLEKLEGANVAELAKRVDVLSKSVSKKRTEAEASISVCLGSALNLNLSETNGLTREWMKHLNTV
jgi:hypothetical protein